MADAGITDPQKQRPHANITARHPNAPAGTEHVDMPREKESSAKKRAGAEPLVICANMLI